MVASRNPIGIVHVSCLCVAKRHRRGGKGAQDLNPLKDPLNPIHFLKGRFRGRGCGHPYPGLGSAYISLRICLPN